jgi:hypothetical protein
LETRKFDNSCLETLHQFLPPQAYSTNPSTSIMTKYVHTSTNKIRCPINIVRVGRSSTFWKFSCAGIPKRGKESVKSSLNEIRISFFFFNSLHPMRGEYWPGRPAANSHCGTRLHSTLRQFFKRTIPLFAPLIGRNQEPGWCRGTTMGSSNTSNPTWITCKCLKATRTAFGTSVSPPMIVALLAVGMMESSNSGGLRNEEKREVSRVRNVSYALCFLPMRPD